MAKVSVRLDNGDVIQEIDVPQEDIVTDASVGGPGFATDDAQQRFCKEVCEAVFEAVESESDPSSGGT